MRDSALKLRGTQPPLRPSPVGEELMRDSALKRSSSDSRAFKPPTGRRRAHARQRFETDGLNVPHPVREHVGEELMRDSALKPSRRRRITANRDVGEELMRDSALKLLTKCPKTDTPRVVGEELMRDSALKRSRDPCPRSMRARSEKSSCATAL